jgi:hypothetical protein
MLTGGRDDGGRLQPHPTKKIVSGGSWGIGILYHFDQFDTVVTKGQALVKLGTRVNKIDCHF